MEYKKLMRERRSVRRFEEKPIPHEVIERIVDTARFSPTWKNTQIARFFIVEDRKIIEGLATDPCTYGFSFNAKTILSAQAVCVLAYKKGRSGFDKDGSYSTPKEDRWQNFDCGIYASNFCLAAADEGIGTVILGYFDDKEIRKVMEIPEDMEVGAIIPMGYPKFIPDATPRKEVSDLVTYF